MEIDKKLMAILEETLRDFENVTIIYENILKISISALAVEFLAA